jgi:hypothetical protein
MRNGDTGTTWRPRAAVSRSRSCRCKYGRDGG